MRRIDLIVLALIGAGIAAGAGAFSRQSDEGQTADAAEAGMDIPPGCPVALRGLDEPLHWSATPHFAKGNEVVLTRFLRFAAREGQTYNAKMFLIEFRPERLEVKEADRWRMKGATARVVCWAYEIEAGEGYQPDFDVPARYVQRTSAESCRISLGTLDCDVRLVRRDKP